MREEGGKELNSSFEIVDTTLRDGEQSAGLVFSAEDKIMIAKALDTAGIRWIEAGTPAMGIGEQRMLSRLFELGLHAELIAWNRANSKDILDSIACGFTWIHISLPVSDLHIYNKLRKNRDWVIEQLKRTIAFAKEHGCDVMVGAEDSSRADPDFFLKFAHTAAENGACRIRYADTVGSLEPFSSYQQLKYVAKRCPLPIEFHGHNDFGLALANTLAAYKAGVAYASGTISGIGERAGNVSLQELSRALKTIYHYDCALHTAVLDDIGRRILPDIDRFYRLKSSLDGGISS